jgi:hypothetical protein
MTFAKIQTYFNQSRGMITITFSVTEERLFLPLAGPLKICFRSFADLIFAWVNNPKAIFLFMASLIPAGAKNFLIITPF